MADPVQSLNEAVRLLQAGQWDAAERCCRQCIEASPNEAGAWFLLGAAKHAQGAIDAALAAFERAVQLQPGNVQALNAMGSMLGLQGKTEQAIECYRQALAVAPGDAQTLTNIGVALEQANDLQAALDQYDAALESDPRFYAARLNRGALLLRMQRFDAALDNNERLAADFPGQADAHFNCAEALLALGRYAEALSACERALALDAKHAAAWIDRGVALAVLARFDLARQAFDVARALDPERVVQMARLIDTTSQRPLAELDPRLIYLHKLYLAQEACDWSRRAEWIANFDSLVASAAGGPDEIRDFNLPFRSLGVPIAPETRLALAKGTARKVRLSVLGESAAPARRLAAPSRSSIRVGYVSPDFRTHPCGFLTRNLYRLHNRAAFSVYAYAVYPGDDSDVSREIVAGCDVFRSCADLSSQAIAGMIAEDGVDIVIDLAGYTNFARPEVFAYRPAPIQVNYLGFPGTTGADYIDYAIVDAAVCPSGSERYWTEKLVYMPEFYFIGDSRPPGELPVLTRADVGLPPDGFVFCCFNNSYKIEPVMFEIWMRLLGAVPGSVLWVHGTEDVVGANLRREAQVHGIAAERIVLAPFRPRERHLARYRLADLFLDTLWYNAHTTAADALWMGLPLVTCPGDTMPSRVAASLLAAAGMPELIVPDLESYQRLALRFATGRGELEQVRRKLVANRASAPLFDTERFVRHLEDAYRVMWQRARSGEAPRSFTVPRRPRR